MTSVNAPFKRPRKYTTKLKSYHMTENYCKDCIHLKSRQLHLSDYIDYYCDKLLFSIYPPKVNEHTEKDNCFEAVKH